MDRNKGFISYLFQGDELLGDVFISPQDADHSYVQYLFDKEIRVTSLSPPSERCLPLTVLHTIASNGPWFKLIPAEQHVHGLDQLYTTCLEEAKTAVVQVEDGNELHLVAMGPRPGTQPRPCFWAFLTSEGMYASCLAMLNLRCLAMVFDLDETLIVANTMRSFENRIEALDRKIRAAENDPQRRAGMAAEMKRYQDDRSILKQYVDSDQVYENGVLMKASGELVPPLVEGGLPLMRPIIRLPERNMVLTRINPAVRDTSVLVRLRPAWEELRSYLIAKGRKRFEVYICTMSERDYALEMWRLLDPESRLINIRELMERVVCVKSGNKKSLVNVFPHHRCHPKMAMVVDDRLKVWEDVDQPRVHVVPAFAPYYAPQAETNSQIPVLCVARNIACNVRAGFFKHFDENLSQQMSEVHFDTDVTSLPRPPDVSNYLVSEGIQEGAFAMFGVTNGPPKEFPDGMANSEVEARMDQARMDQATNNIGIQRTFTGETEEMRQALDSLGQIVQPPPLTHILPGTHVAQPINPMDPRQDDMEVYPHTGGGEHQHYIQQPAIQRPISHMHKTSAQGSSPAREEGEVPESELDPDTRRRLLILQHGMDTNHAREQLAHEVKVTSSIPSFPAPGGWLGGEEEMSPRRPTRPSPELVLEPESPSFDSQQRLQGPPGFTPVVDGPFHTDRSMPRDPRRRQAAEEMFIQDDRKGPDGFPLEHAVSDEDEQSLARVGSGMSDVQLHSGPPVQTNFVDVLQGIAQRCKAVVEYKSLLTSASTRLLFTVEVLFAGQKVGEGTGRTKKEAKIHAAEDALRFLARQFPSQGLQQPMSVGSRLGNHAFLGPVEEGEPMLARQSSRDPRISAGLGPANMELELTVPSTSGQINYDYSRQTLNFVQNLKERCTILGVNVNFQELPSSVSSVRKIFICQVEVGGQVMGKGSGITWDAAKQYAAEEALRNLKQGKRANTPRSPPIGAKRIRIGLPSSPGRGRGRLSPRRRPPLP
ncbi:hypothetical protein R1sor_015467 [Riccia sorocarpa]|uniref:protein-serine/threonine phosphatase n=1 Tax=Riccia sorocarpa TaxID=122646 RepID=A0ABD3HCN2_9MARC